MKVLRSVGGDVLGDPSGMEARAREASRSAGGFATSRPLWSEGDQPAGSSGTGAVRRCSFAASSALRCSSGTGAVMAQCAVTCCRSADGGAKASCSADLATKR